jgi:hypothetical protein
MNHTVVYQGAEMLFCEFLERFPEKDRRYVEARVSRGQTPDEAATPRNWEWRDSEVRMFLEKNHPSVDYGTARHILYRNKLSIAELDVYLKTKYRQRKKKPSFTEEFSL